MIGKCEVRKEQDVDGAHIFGPSQAQKENEENHPQMPFYQGPPGYGPMYG